MKIGPFSPLLDDAEILLHEPPGEFQRIAWRRDEVPGFAGQRCAACRRHEMNHSGAHVVRLATRCCNVSRAALLGHRQRAEYVLVPFREQTTAFRHLLGVACVDFEPGGSGTVVSPIAMRYGPVSNGR